MGGGKERVKAVETVLLPFRFRFLWERSIPNLPSIRDKWLACVSSCGRETSACLVNVKRTMDDTLIWYHDGFKYSECL
jgi:hypothetical protein